MSGVRLYLALGIALALLTAIGAHIASDGRTRSQLADTRTALHSLEGDAARVLAVTRKASDNPGLKWRDAAQQIAFLGNSRKAWKGLSEIQTARIDELGLETARLKRLGAADRKRADAAIAVREKAIDQLKRRALTPGERSDCARQLREAEEALDLVFREGL